jgi:hypothetical protein
MFYEVSFLIIVVFCDNSICTGAGGDGLLSFRNLKFLLKINEALYVVLLLCGVPGTHRIIRNV